ncbi:MAG: septum site-determining protein MinC [Clostridiaceae bacterium]
MKDDGIIIKGNKDGLNIIIDFYKFKDFEDMLVSLNEKLSKGRQFYKGAVIRISTQMKLVNDKNRMKLKDILFDNFMIKDCIYEDIAEEKNKIFSGIYEGKTKFISKTIRGGQVINYPGNIVIMGDVNNGAEIHAGGNVVVFGSIKGHVYAGVGGNNKAIIAGFKLTPEILKIGDVIARAPDEDEIPLYPEIAKIVEGFIVVEPYKQNI